MIQDTEKEKQHMSEVTKVKNDLEKAGEWFEKLFHKSAAWDKTALVAIQVVAPVVEGFLAVTDPALVGIIQPIVEQVEQDLTLAATLIADGTANPTLTGALNAVKSNMSGLVGAAAVKNSASAAKITADADVVISSVEAILASLPTITAA
jgi:hypothetical protein